jgi:hypothetical protein
MDSYDFFDNKVYFLVLITQFPGCLQFSPILNAICCLNISKMVAQAFYVCALELYVFLLDRYAPSQRSASVAS